jgi:hypothetical protein
MRQRSGRETRIRAAGTMLPTIKLSVPHIASTFAQ